MLWQERSVMSQRHEFVAFAAQEGATISALCEQAGISRKTGYKWVARAAAGDQELADRSRRPRASPAQISPELEARILGLRAEHPAWGARKRHHRLDSPLGRGSPRPVGSPVSRRNRRELSWPHCAPTWM